MKKLGASFLVIFLLLFSNNSFAGHGMALVNPSFTVNATSLTFTASSNAATCGGGPYWLQVELRCTAGQLTGTPPATMQTNLLNWAGPGVTYNNFPWYNSLLNVPNYSLASSWPDACTTEPYNPVTIPFTGLCPGQTYYFSAREWVSGTNSVGPWTTPSSFVVPGVFVPLNFNIVATPSVFCNPGSATLSVNSITGGCGSTSVLWSPGGSTLNSVVVSPAATTSYTALVSTPCNTLTKVVTVSVVPNVSAAFTPVNSATCTGSTVQFNHTGTAGVSHTWAASPAAGVTINTVNSASPSITFANPGVYAISHTVSAGSCTNVVTTNITVSGVAVTFSTPNYTQCLQGNSFTFSSSSAVGTHTYAFNPAAGAPPTGNTSTYGPVSFTSPGTYTVTYSNNNGGCTATSSSVVVINPQPTVTANNNGPICVGGNLNLTSTGGGTYSWSGPGGFTSAAQNPSIPNVALTNAGVYTVTVTLNGCTSTNTTNVVVSTTTASASNTGPYCAGQTIQLNGSAGTTYTWSGPGGFTSSLQNPTIPASTAAMSGVYNFTVASGICVATSSTNVVVNALPTPAPTNTGPYCAGSTIQLNVGAFSTYTWTGPSAFSSNSQNPTQANSTVANGGIYTVSVTNAAGCVNTSTTNVVVNPIPVANIGSNSPICVGTSLNLTSSGGTTYSWSGPNGFTSALQNPTIASAAVVNSGVYTVTVTSLGCSSTNTVNVVVSTATATASNTGPYCSGTTVQLNSSVGTSYSWSGPGGFNSALQNPTIAGASTAASGTYSVIVSIGTCTAMATTIVTVNALPTPTAGSNSAICEGATLNLTGSSATTYTWSGPNSFSSNTQNPSIASASVNAAGTYTLGVTDANGCSNIVTTVVVVNVGPAIVVNNPTVCINQAINLTANGGVGYSWSGPNGFTSALQNPTIANAALNMSGPYTVTVTSAQGCTNTAIASVSVYPVPVPNIVSNSPVCVGNALILSANGGASYAWVGPNGFLSNTQNNTINNVTLPASGIYTVVASAGTCSASTTASITINPLPTPNIISNSPVCEGVSMTFTGTGGTNYTWNGPAGFSSSSNNPSILVSSVTNSGTYTLSVTDANGCVNATTSNFIVNPTPNVSATGTTACENSNPALSASGGVLYNWSGPGGYTSSSQNAIITGAPLTSAGQYTVVVTDANTCTNTAVASLIVVPAPTPSIVTNSPICENTVLSLTGTGGLNYSWSGPNGFSSVAQNPTVTASSTSFSGNYVLTVTDATGCVGVTSTSVQINGIPSINITSTLNKGCAPLCVTFTCNSSAPLTTFDWNLGNGATGDTQVSQTCYGTSGIYTVSVSGLDNIGCSSSATYTVDVFPQPIADYNYAPLKPVINIDPEVTFTDASHGAIITEWNWYFMNTAQYTSNAQNPIFVYDTPGAYAVALVVKSDKGCLDTIVKEIIVSEDFGIYVPNAFTPNGDGLNDIFQPKGFGIVKYELQIFDRWGEKVFGTKTFDEGWKGNFLNRGGDILEEGTYTWLINCVSVFGKAHELKGHVTLIK